MEFSKIAVREAGGDTDTGVELVKKKKKEVVDIPDEVDVAYCWVTQKLPQIYTANHATFPIRIRKITVQICGNFWVTQYNS